MSALTSRGRGRAAATSLVVVGALTLAGCSAEDRPTLPQVSLPSFTMPSGDDLKSFVDGARAQLDEIGGDVASAAKALDGLSGSARDRARDAVGSVEGAVGQVQEALDSARADKDGAQDQLAAAGERVRDARARVDDALASLGTSTDEATVRARDEMSRLAAELGRLHDEVTGT